MTITIQTVFTDDNPQGIAWSPDGQYLLATTLQAPPTPNILMYEAISFPSQCVIKGNVVYCNSGGVNPQGVGISGSSIANYIVGNTAYSNPCVPFAGIDSNYVFVTNAPYQFFDRAIFMRKDFFEGRLRRGDRLQAISVQQALDAYGELGRVVTVVDDHR